jgi:hypothetical protein
VVSSIWFIAGGEFKKNILMSTSQGRGYHMESVYCRGRIPKKYFTEAIAKIAYFAGGKKPFTF